MVNTKSSSQMSLQQLPENPPQQNQEQQLQRQRQPEDILRRIEEWEHCNNLQRQEAIRIMQEYMDRHNVHMDRHNASLRRKVIQRMRLVEEHMDRHNAHMDRHNAYMDRHNASLRRKGIQRMGLVEENMDRHNAHMVRHNAHMDRHNAYLRRKGIQRMRLVEEHMDRHNVHMDRYNASLQRKGIQIMWFVKEHLERIENSVRNKNRNESNPIQVNASGSLQVNAGSLVRINVRETEQVKSSIKKEEPLQVICEICAETKRITEMIKNQTCRHSYCSDCMTKHVATKIQDIITAVPCPGLDCKSVFELEACRPWLAKDLIERWDKALCEALFLQVPKFYCPFKDCSAMMLVENEEDQQAGETECPICYRMFCARCNIPWHIGVNCKEYKKQNENERQREDRLMRKLAKEKRWRRCPKCKFYVEKITGCVHITCRCKYEFCYECGQQWCFSHTHLSSGRD